jgi:ADP-ribose pyrophosphatase YjhB (NUDIX family)
MGFNFCPRCGKALVMNEGKPTCTSCGFIFYDNPVPSAAVIGCVNGKFVLVRRLVEPGKGGLGFPGGFIEENESSQEAAVREFKEETGLVCSDLTLLTVVPVKYVVPGVEKNVLCVYFVAGMVLGTPHPGSEESEIVFRSSSELVEDDLVLGDNKTAFKVFKENFLE